MRRNKQKNRTHNIMGKAASRKGMGMELALLVLFMVFACSILLVSSAVLGKQNMTDRYDRLSERFALDMAAEQALKDSSLTEHENYGITRENNTLIITDRDGQTKLTVTWDGSNTITGWTYG